MLRTLLNSVRDLLRSRVALQMEVLALRHQLTVYQRTATRPRIRPADRLLWSWLSRHWSRWRDVLVIVRPETVITWRKRKFREHWTKLARSGKPGRPTVAKEIRDLIHRISSANPLWGAPRIMGELRKIGINLQKSTVEKYMVRRRKPPAPTWRAFLKNHVKEIVAIDFFVVPTVRNQVLFVFLLLAHDRRRVLHFNVTANPTAAWTAQQIVEAFPNQDPPRYLLRVNEDHLRRILTRYFRYYHRWRTHRSLALDCPEPRVVQPIGCGRVVEFEEIGGLHHHYERFAA